VIWVAFVAAWAVALLIVRWQQGLLEVPRLPQRAPKPAGVPTLMDVFRGPNFDDLASPTAVRYVPRRHFIPEPTVNSRQEAYLRSVRIPHDESLGAPPPELIEQDIARRIRELGP
jgi:hypothetical protein